MASSPKLHQDIFDHYGNKNLSIDNGYLSPSDTLFDDSDIYTSDDGESDDERDTNDDSDYDVSEPEVSRKSELPVAAVAAATTVATSNTRRISNPSVHPLHNPHQPQQQQPKRTDLAAPRPTENPTIFQKLTKASVDWCRYCGTTEGVNWRPGPWGKRTLCK
jgi:predicted component of type VI protein secretion system